jgi:RNA ligase
VNHNKIKQYVIDGWVEETKHPTKNLFIYNYSRKTQFDSKWDDITLNCRGLILDENGNLIARGFSKFFNYEELPQNHSAFDIIAKENPIVQNKCDGSLGIIYYYDNKWNVATRGSFMSEQAQKAEEMLHNLYRVDLLNPEYTYLVEIIYVENTIVVVYNEEKLFFLSIYHKDKELSWSQCKEEFNRCQIPHSHIVKEYGNVFDYKSLKNSFEENREGYIVKFEPSNYRVKIKFDEYVRLHKLITNFSNVDIWECLKNEDDIYAFLDKVPDEFDKWVRGKIFDLNKSFDYILSVCNAKKDELNNQQLENRKDKALWIQSNVIPRYQKILYSMLDNRNYKPLIWDLVRPKYQKPFWNREE